MSRLLGFCASPAPIAPPHEACAPGPRSLREIDLRPAVAWDLVVLQELDSPLVKVARIMMEGQPPESVRREIRARVVELPGETPGQASARLNAEMAEAFFVFTHKPAEVRALLRQGREAFRETAMATLDELPFTAAEELAEMIGEHFQNSFAAAFACEAEILAERASTKDVER